MSLAKPLPNLHYFRLDELNTNGETTWATVKSFLAAGFPVPTSMTAAANIRYRPNLDSPRGGQAVVAVGYRTSHFGRGQDALLIRSSWGSQWGDNGYGWDPASYIHKQRGRDFWTLASHDWLDSSELARPSILDSLEPTHRPN